MLLILKFFLSQNFFCELKRLFEDDKDSTKCKGHRSFPITFDHHYIRMCFISVLCEPSRAVVYPPHPHPTPPNLMCAPADEAFWGFCNILGVNPCCFLTWQAFGGQGFPLGLDGQRWRLEPRGRPGVQPDAAQHAQRGSERAGNQHPSPRALSADQGPAKKKKKAPRRWQSLSPSVSSPLIADVSGLCAATSAFPQHQLSPRSLVPGLFYSPTSLTS